MTETSTSSPSLYERIGGANGLRGIVKDVVAAHLANPSIGMRFEPHDPKTLEEQAFLFFAAGTGGPEVYEGRGLRETHRGMNVNEQELVASTDDLLAVLNNHNVGAQEQMELLAAFYSMKDDVLHL